MSRKRVSRCKIIHVGHNKSYKSYKSDIKWLVSGFKEVSPILASKYTFQRFVAAAAALSFFLLGLSSRDMIASSIELSSRVMIQQLSL